MRYGCRGRIVEAWGETLPPERNAMAINQYAEVVCDECGAYDDGDPIDAIDNFGKWLCWDCRDED